jgi:uncharacterized membrane protein
MPFCPVCGAPVDGRFCQKCGAPATAPAGAANFVPPPTPAEAGALPLPPAAAADAGLTENAVGALCYLGGIVTGIIFLVVPPYDRNPRIKFHAFQSILFNLVWMLGWFALIPLGMILPFGLSLILSLFSLLLWGGGFVLWLFLMWQAYQGQTLVLPVIGSIARQQAGK